MPKITKRTVDAAAPKASRYYVWDTEIRGFGVLVLPSGVKSHIYRYRTPEGTERRATIGKHGDWTADEARDKADAMRRVVKDGGDPLGEKKAVRQAPTIGDVLDAYLASERFADKARTTQITDRGRIERHLRPLLGRRHVHLLTANDIERAKADIRDGKTAADFKTGKPRGRARVKGGPVAAQDTIGLLKAILAWAVRERIVSTNPAQHVTVGSHATRDTVIEDAADYGRLFKTLDRMEREKRIRAPAADAIRLIALTGARRGEVAGLRWSHVDLKRGQLVLPPSAHKTGRKTGKPREIGLPAVAQAIIGRQPAGEPDDFVFKPAKGSGAMALSRIWNVVRGEAELPEGIGLHGLRHSIGSTMAWAGAGAPEIMAALGHNQLSTVSRYIHWAQSAKSALSERAAAVAIAGMAVSTRDKDEKAPDVVNLRGRRD